MSTARSPTALVLALALVLATSACSGDGAGAGAGGGEGPGAPDREALVAGLSGLYAGDHAQPSERENGECFAEALLDRTDADALREGGVVDETGEVVAELPVLERPLAVAWAGAQLECVDFVAESARAQSARSKGAVDEAAYADCLRAAITADEIEEALVASLTGEWESPAVARLADAQAGCVDGGR